MPMKRTKLSRSLKRNAPIIFKVVGLIGLIAAPILTVPSTVKAVRACDRRKEELGVEKLPAGEIVKTSWKYYIPVLSLMGASTVSMVNGESISNKRTAILSAAYNAAEQTLTDYKGEVRKQLTDEQANQIEQKVFEKQVERSREEMKFIGIQGTKGPDDELFYDPATGAYFYSSENKIAEAFNKLTSQLLEEDYVDLSDLFYYLGLRKVTLCDIVGWNSSKTRCIKAETRWWGDRETNTPYKIMEYNIYPTANYVE